MTILVALAFVLWRVAGTPEAPDDPGSDAAVESTTSSAATAGPSFDGPPAPDFEMALSDGSTFSLSDEQKPVYLVFWAEW